MNTEEDGAECNEDDHSQVHSMYNNIHNLNYIIYQ